MRRLAITLWAAVVLCGGAGHTFAAEASDEKALAQELLTADLAGGLCVHLGAGNGKLTAALAAGGRFLVHGLEPDAAMAESAIRLLRSRGIYGQAWVEPYAAKRLPYAENLVNVLVADDFARTEVPVKEIFRVLCPGGVACLGQRTPTAKPLDADRLKREFADAGFLDIRTLERGGTWLRARKPRPPEMGEWGHPRHASDGNAVSADRLVNPPRRVRWLAGPMHEASNMVTAGGRFFHAGVIARDAFNGLRLWQTKVEPTPLRLGYPATALRGSVLPVAAGDRLYVVTGGELQSLDAATGRPVRAYGDIPAPLEVLSDGGTLVTLDAGGVHALEADGGRVLWTYAAAQPVAVTGDGGVYVLEGYGSARSIVKLSLATGKVAWRQREYPWAAKARQLSYHKGLVVCEVSTFDNNRPGNGIHVLDARDGRRLWELLYEPGQNHYMQARALQTDDVLWVLRSGEWQGLERLTGAVREKYKAGPNHCYPPVATSTWLIGEEMSFTAMDSGRTDSNRISKGACGREAGFVPANGLLYVAPKHCACYPMLKGYYSALAPAKPGESAPAPPPEPGDFAAERGPAFSESPAASAPARQEWPCYRADLWRSASSPAPVPAELEVLWTAEIGDWPKVPLAADWKDNLYARGPITAPVAAGGKVFVAQPEGHRIVALDAATGKSSWEFTANGRIDTPPTIAGDLCLFGCRSGWVYGLRTADGKLVWRLRAGPEDERIIDCGQLESPWPVPGSVLVIGDTAYLAAGRHPLADGGIRLLAVDPATGKVKRARTLTSLPVIKNYYLGAALEFDCFDLLVAEARQPGLDKGPTSARGAGPDFVTMSRWQMDLASGEVEIAYESGFGYHRAGTGGVLAPRGLWTYGQRMDYIASGPKPNEPDFVAATARPLAAFRDGTVIASTEDKRQLFRRDFTDETAAAFDDTWFTHRTLPKKDAPGDRSRSDRLAHGAAWTRAVFEASDRAQAIAAVVIAGDKVLAAGKRGRLLVFALADGKKLAERDLPAPAWDGLAAAYGNLYVSTQDGKVLCLGRRP